MLRTSRVRGACGVVRNGNVAHGNWFRKHGEELQVRFIEMKPQVCMVSAVAFHGRSRCSDLLKSAVIPKGDSMEELGLFSRISKLCFYLGAAVSCLILTYVQVVPVNSVLAAIAYILLLLVTVLTQVANVYVYFREPHIENLWLKGATLKTKIRKYLLSAKPYLFFAFGLAAIFFLWLAFVYFHTAC